MAFKHLTQSVSLAQLYKVVPGTLSVVTAWPFCIYRSPSPPSLCLFLSLTLLHIGRSVGGLPERKKEKEEGDGSKSSRGWRAVVAEGRVGWQKEEGKAGQRKGTRQTVWHKQQRK